MALTEIETLRAVLENLGVKAMFRLNKGPDPALTKEWMEYTVKITRELLVWQDRFYVHCKYDPESK